MAMTKRCPFCGASWESGQIAVWFPGRSDEERVECKACGATGLDVRNWNKRIMPDPDAEFKRQVLKNQRQVLWILWVDAGGHPGSETAQHIDAIDAYLSSMEQDKEK